LSKQKYSITFFLFQLVGNKNKITLKENFHFIHFFSRRKQNVSKVSSGFDHFLLTFAPKSVLGFN
jgi:hypothetical protein